MGICCTNEKPGCKWKCPLLIAAFILAAAGFGLIVMLLWNWLLPAAFPGAQEIGYLQALGLLLLCRLLFGGLHCGHHGRWKEHRRQWEAMTPEEREQLKSQFKSRWGKCGGTGKTENETPT